MLQVENLILYFLLLVLKILLNFYLDIGYKQVGFSETLLEKNLKFVLNRKNNIIALNLSLVLLQAKIDLVVKK